MPGDPRECRERAARCLQLAAEAANDGIKQTFLTLARHWQSLAEELERTKKILDDEKGGLKVSSKRRRKKSAAGKSKTSNKTSNRSRKRKHPGASITKRTNGQAILSVLKDAFL